MDKSIENGRETQRTNPLSFWWKLLFEDKGQLTTPVQHTSDILGSRIVLVPVTGILLTAIPVLIQHLRRIRRHETTAAIEKRLIAEREAIIQEQTRILLEKDRIILEKDRLVTLKDRNLQVHDNRIRELEGAIEEQKQLLKAQQITIEANEIRIETLQYGMEVEKKFSETWRLEYERAQNKVIKIQHQLMEVQDMKAHP